MSLCGHLVKQVSRFDRLCRGTILARLEVPVTPIDGRFHELVGDADGVVGVLICNRSIGL
jgi:hypothetical protein